MGAGDEDETRESWTNVGGLRQSKKFIELNKERAGEVRNLPRADLRRLCGAITGYYPYSYHLSKLGLANTEKCRYCEEDIETMEHILRKCPALRTKRRMYLGDYFINETSSQGLNNS